MADDRALSQGAGSAAPKNIPPANRWYDRQPQVKQSVEMLGAFPDEVLTVLAEGVNAVIEREYRVQDLLRSFRSLGEDKVLALYKSKNKLRKLDQNPTMHKTVNYLFVVAEENKVSIALQVLDLINTVHQYLLLCRDNGFTPTVQHIKRIQGQYVSAGNAAAKEALAEIRAEIMQLLVADRTSVLTPAPEAEPEADNRPADRGKQVFIQGNDQGMRININSP